ncbi:Ionotropic receptor 585 [Blattella germanica]|nr:Ionotropic receptor 585 [Blattella germanica]
MVRLLVYIMTYSDVLATIPLYLLSQHMSSAVMYIGENYFPISQPLAVSFPHLREFQDPGKKEEGEEIFIGNLHVMGLWPIIVFGDQRKFYYDFTNSGLIGSYIFIVRGLCDNLQSTVELFNKRIFELLVHSWRSWNPKAVFLVCITSNCDVQRQKLLARYFLSILWSVRVGKAMILFEVNAYAKWTVYFWYPYTTAMTCSPDDDLRMCDLEKEENKMKSCFPLVSSYGRNYQGCPLKIIPRISEPFVSLPKNAYNNSTTIFYDDGWEIKLIQIISKQLNMTEIYLRTPEQFLTTNLGAVLPLLGGMVDIALGSVDAQQVVPTIETTASYLTVKEGWYTPCARKMPRWSSFFRTLSGVVWFIVSLSLFAATFIAVYIARREEIELTSYKKYGTTFIYIWVIILGESVPAIPHSTPLRLFFLAWVLYSFVLNTVFQSSLTAFLVDPGYELPIRTVEELVKSGTKYGFFPGRDPLFNDSSDILSAIILKNRIPCADPDLCLEWASSYGNITTLHFELYVQHKYWDTSFVDENDKPKLCELYDGTVYNIRIGMLMTKRSPMLDHVNYVLNMVIEAGIFIQWKKSFFDMVRIKARGKSQKSLVDSYFAMTVTHFQSAFYISLLGYSLAFLTLMIELICFNIFEIRNRDSHKCNI